MINEVIFYTQIGSITAYIGALFGIYKILVKQKDATIENLKTNNEFLREQNQILKESSSDILLERLKKRLELSSEELKNLSTQDNEKQILLTEKEEKLKNALNAVEEYDIGLKRIKELLKEYLCPYCNAPQIRKEYHEEYYRDESIEHEYIEYECGLRMEDNKIVNVCRYKKQK